MSSPEKAAVISAITAVERSSPEVLVEKRGTIAYDARRALSQDIANLERVAMSVAEKFEQASAAPQTETAKDITIKQLSAALAQKDAAVQEKDAIIQQKDVVIKKQDAIIQQKDVVIQQKDAALAEKDKTIGQLGIAITIKSSGKEDVPKKEGACCIVM